jgi:hypothetical protein
MAIHDYECDKCKFKEEFIISPSVIDPIPENCPKCSDGKLVKLFPKCNRVGVDVLGGYDYEYGKKAYKKRMSDQEYAGCLVKDDSGNYKDPY